MLRPQTEVLKRFEKHVLSQSKRNLTQGKHNASKQLYNSIKGEVKQNPNSIQLLFTMLEYGYFQDRGVKGVKGGKSLSGFSYKDKMPPASAFDKWTVRKGLAPRTREGQFKTRKQLNFAIARKVYLYGIKPTEFFTKPFESAFKNLPDEMVESYGLEVNQLFDEIMMQNLKKK